MARVERVLAVDIGASSIKVGEFEYPGKGGIVLTGFDQREYEEELNESSRAVLIAGLLRQILVENAFTARKVLLCISGQSAFTRFVKLPPVADEEHRVRQIVEFEARQNVPFSMDEVIWDYQLIAAPEAEELEVMFVVIKNDTVEEITGAVRSIGLELQLVDVAPVACYNAARANHIGDEACSMVLNIGGRSTNLLFADKTRFFTRTIPIAGHTITQQLAKEFGIGFAEAEELKRRHGFVALGGAYEEPESEVAAAVSKIIRNVMARLHGEINRSINVYRAQQKGNRPTALFLTGGSSTMAYTDHFFAEKLRMDVSYFNPFQVVSLGPGVNSSDLQEKAHMFSEVVGLGLRYRVQCPVEVSLVPAAIRREQLLNKKKPYFAACLAAVLLMMLVGLLVNQTKAGLYAAATEEMTSIMDVLDRKYKEIQSLLSEAASLESQYRGLEDLLKQRENWPRILNAILKAKPENLWLDQFELISGKMPSADDTADDFGGGGGEFGGSGGFEGMGGGGMDAGTGGGDDFLLGGGGVTPDIVGIKLTGHGVSLRPPKTEAMPTGPGFEQESSPESAEPPAEGDDDEPKPAPEDPELIESNPELVFIKRLQADELFDEDASYTRIVTFRAADDLRNYRTFVINVRLAEPLSME